VNEKYGIRRNLIGITYFGVIVKYRRLQWIKHVTTVGKTRYTYRYLVGTCLGIVVWKDLRDVRKKLSYITG
jgi:hypothetical protein